MAAPTGLDAAEKVNPDGSVLDAFLSVLALLSCHGPRPGPKHSAGSVCFALLARSYPPATNSARTVSAVTPGGPSKSRVSRFMLTTRQVIRL
jgi:hypothetical protein